MLLSEKMPKGIMPLYLIQAFSTFSYAILYSSLSLFLTKQLELSNTLSNSIVGLFLALNYVLHLLGGVIGGRFLSNRALFLITTAVQTIGILLLALSVKPLLYLGLSLFLVGCGLNTTAYNSLLTQRFASDDNRRDKAFFLSYSYMNVGFCAGYILSGFFDYSNQYQTLLYASIIPNVITLLLMWSYWTNLNDRDTPLLKVKSKASLNFKKSIGWGIILSLIPFTLLCFHKAQFSNGVVVGLSVIMFFVILYLGYQQKSTLDKQKIMTFLILTVTSILFWMIYFTGPMGITLFIKNNVDKHLFHYEMATQWLLNINAMVIIIGAPLLSIVLTRLQAKGYNVSITKQFVWAFLILAGSFFCLSSGILSANKHGYVSVYWVMLHFTTQAIAELLIGPVGYAMIGKISPPHLQGVLMGTWMMVSGVSASLSHYFSNAMTKGESTNPLLSNGDYQHVFNQLGMWALLGAVFLYLIAKRIKPVIEQKTDSELSGAISAT
ncbi:TPA: peptide MFS transporter [Legionella pneumophila]|uniref:Peptide MFS transporter n=1 Tax=Legionella pneumophila TaxID=446 RepID=A0AAN5Q1W7_LEGPN|nr:oligopeptide:H+ symporter [Legionella pneumophila]MDW9167241.1 oligopeptide:H+ symporter [Legionella pneumophila subsp. fraseri]AMV15256.1 Dipeptide and tripeptide permease A [Legionella pneumophila]MCH9145099.1 peptide MFS transporter [Legionella pneumophila serogroup 1]MCH9157200.1 peptide MFS transporter [Legionella pneumophila serogroup 1]MCZ4739373.1 oligopeptide:H+ symporter [Legionella pneumophila]